MASVAAVGAVGAAVSTASRIKECSAGGRGACALAFSNPLLCLSFFVGGAVWSVIAHRLVRRQVPPHQAFVQFWSAVRALASVAALVDSAGEVARAMLDPSRVDKGVFRFTLITDAWVFFLIAIATPARRRGAQEWLKKVGSERADSDRAALAALVGGTTDDETIAAANDTFRLVPWP